MARKVKAAEFRSKEGATHFVKVIAYTKRTTGRNSGAFIGCVRIAGSRNDRGWECMPGSSPRRALGGAMKRMSSTLAKRSSAFRGMR